MLRAKVMVGHIKDHYMSLSRKEITLDVPRIRSSGENSIEKEGEPITVVE